MGYVTFPDVFFFNQIVNSLYDFYTKQFSRFYHDLR